VELRQGEYYIKAFNADRDGFLLKQFWQCAKADILIRAKSGPAINLDEAMALGGQAPTSAGLRTINGAAPPAHRQLDDGR
jgi:hypothetical protein